jgi:hypothetical protein
MRKFEMGEKGTEATTGQAPRPKPWSMEADRAVPERECVYKNSPSRSSAGSCQIFLKIFILRPFQPTLSPVLSPTRTVVWLR